MSGSSGRGGGGEAMVAIVSRNAVIENSAATRSRSSLTNGKAFNHPNRGALHSLIGDPPLLNTRITRIYTMEPIAECTRIMMGRGQDVLSCNPCNPWDKVLHQSRIRPILKYGDSQNLHATGTARRCVKPDIERLIDDMIETIYAAPASGWRNSPPQVGVR